MNYLKSIFKGILYIIIGYIVLVILEYARQGFINDLSLQKVYFSKTAKPVYLISYADGAEFYFQNQNATSHYAINKGIDFILNYRKEHLSLEFINKNKEILKAPNGAGMWLWKPYLILETMKNAPEDSIIIYLDAAFQIKKPLTGLIDQLGEKDILLVQDRDRKNGAYVKGETFALMNCLSEECRAAHHIWSAVIIVRNTRAARLFIEQWLENCEDIRILSKHNYDLYPNYPEFLWHHSDQSVLSLIYYLNPAPVQVIPFSKTTEYLAWFHRCNGLHSPNKTWYTVYGSDPVVNFNKNGKTLPSTALLNLPPLVMLRKWYIKNFM